MEEFIKEVKEGTPTTFSDYPYFGDIGRNYGVQWRSWTGISSPKQVVFEGTRTDQISTLLHNIKEKPIGRRHIVTAWNPAEIGETALPACHWAFEILPFPLKMYQRITLSGQDLDYMHELYNNSVKNNSEEATKELEDRLKDVPTYAFTLKWHQRSVDTFLGLPFNIASYGVLAMILEGLTGFKAMGLIGDLSNVHFYETHIEAVKVQLENDPLKHSGCTIQFSEKVKSNFFSFREGKLNFDGFINAFEVEDIEFIDYESYESIKAEMLAPNT